MRRAGWAIVAASLLAALPAWAQDARMGSGVGREAPPPGDAPAGTPPSRDHPPMFDPRRYTEDYRYLDDPAQRSGAWWEPAKAISLDDDGGLRLAVGGEARIRAERYENNLFRDEASADDTYLWERLLPYAELRVGQRLRLFGQIEGAWSQGQKGGPSPLDQTRVDVLQAFAEVVVPAAGGAVGVRAGRQVISYGDGSLIDSRYGPNVLASFDGVFVNYRREAWRGDLFWSRPVRNGPKAFDDSTNDQQQLWGAIVGRDLPSLKRGVLDAYYFGFQNDAAVYGGLTGRERRHSLGLRHVGGLNAVDWKGEAIAQLGAFSTQRIRAFALAGEVGYTLEALPLTPRLHLNGGIASGDGDPADRRLGTFNALFPRGQYFSDTGIIGPYNLINARIGSQFVLTPRLRLDVLTGFYWRARETDGVYRNGGAPLVAAPEVSGRFVATQIEGVLDYSLSRGIDLRFTLAGFRPGEVLRSAGRRGTVSFGGAEIRFWF